MSGAIRILPARYSLPVTHIRPFCLRALESLQAVRICLAGVSRCTTTNPQMRKQASILAMYTGHVNFSLFTCALVSRHKYSPVKTLSDTRLDDFSRAIARHKHFIPTSSVAAKVSNTPAWVFSRVLVRLSIPGLSNKSSMWSEETRTVTSLYSICLDRACLHRWIKVISCLLGCFRHPGHSSKLQTQPQDNVCGYGNCCHSRGTSLPLPGTTTEVNCIL